MASQGSTESIPPIPDYELIRRIGRGSYGEVWLARTATQTLRAVKLVWEERLCAPAALDADEQASKTAGENRRRAFEREFDGIRKFESVSHAPNLVTVFHTGRNHDAGFFYYVMDLADDAKGRTPIDANQYEARTLRSDLKVRSRRPIEECVSLGLALADALKQLHSHDLVHRDIKPDNIIFVRGKAKLADIGLVTEIGGTMTNVGTIGYMPPEGPGTESADIYAVGKVLYEVATGKGPREFPALPADLDSLSKDELQSFLDFSVIWEGATASNPRHRYASADHLERDLKRLEAGVPLHRRRRMWDQFGMAAKVLGVASVLAGALLAPKLAHKPQLHLISKVASPPEFNWGVAKTGVVNPNEQIGLFVLANGKIGLWTARGACIKETNAPVGHGMKLELSLVQNTDNDPAAELFLSWTEGTNMNIAVLNHWMAELKRFSALGVRRWFKGNGYTNEMVPVGLSGFESDGRRKLIATVGASFALGPRGVYCFDWDSKTQVWYHPTPSSLQGITFLDMDGNGKLDVVSGTGSSMNGVSLPDGADDDHSYIYGILDDNTRRFRHEVGDQYSTCIVYPIRLARGASPTIFATVGAHGPARLDEGKKEFGTIMKLDSASGKIVAYYHLGAYAHSLVAFHASAKEPVRLLVSDRQGRVHLLDANLNPLRVVDIAPPRYTSTPLFIVGVEDFTGRGRKQVVLTSQQHEYISGNYVGQPDEPPNVEKYHDWTVHLLDDALKPLSEYRVADLAAGEFKASIGDFEGNGGKQILVQTDSLLLLEVR